jgi:hypothetical protein
MRTKSRRLLPVAMIAIILAALSGTTNTIQINGDLVCGVVNP